MPARSIAGNVVMFAACKDGPFTPDHPDGGLCATGFCEALSGWGNPSYKEVLNKMREYSPTSQLSTNVEIDLDTPFVL